MILAAYLFLISNGKDDDCVVLERIQTEDGTIEIVDETCQEGLPHTTDSETIRMTRAKYEGKRIDELLIHERVHLDQKRNRLKWLQFYKQFWDYDIVKESPLPSAYTKRLRPNPDTADAPWAIWRERYVFFPYSDGGELKNAKVRVWDILEKKETSIPEQWKARFCDTEMGCPHQYEHPHEISAEFITKRPRSKAAGQLFQWHK